MKKQITAKKIKRQKPMPIPKDKKIMQEIIADNKDFQSLFTKYLTAKKNYDVALWEINI